MTLNFCTIFTGPGFETLSSQGCSVTGECLLRFLCTGAAGTPTDLGNPGILLQRERAWHPSLQAQNRPLQTTALKCSSLNCLPNTVLFLLRLQALQLLRQRCPPEPVLPPTQGPALRPPPLETGGLSRDPLGRGCQLPGEAGTIPREQNHSPTLSLLSPGGVKASRAGATGDTEGVLRGPQMAGCL